MPEPAPPRAERAAQDDPDPRAPPAQTLAHQHAPPEAQPLELLLDLPEIPVVEFLEEHGEQAPEGRRAEAFGILRRPLTQDPELAGEELQDVEGVVEVHLRGVPMPAPDLLLLLQCLDRQVVQGTHGIGMLDGVVERLLPVEDDVAVVETCEQRLLGDGADDSVASRHRPQEDGEAKVLGQVGSLGRRRRAPVEVAVRVQEANLHGDTALT